MRADEGWVVVYVSQGPLAAEVARSKLEVCDIPVTLRYQAIGRTLGLTVNGLGQVEVLVPASEAAVARELLQDVGMPPQALEEEPPGQGDA